MMRIVHIQGTKILHMQVYHFFQLIDNAKWFFTLKILIKNIWYVYAGLNNSSSYLSEFIFSLNIMSHLSPITRSLLRPLHVHFCQTTDFQLFGWKAQKNVQW